MGLYIGRKTCVTNPSCSQAIAPNPNPKNWELIKLEQYNNAYVMKVRYQGCTNFEGIKIMVYQGKYSHRDYLDPHFCQFFESPIARFKPTMYGWELANSLAMSL